MVKIGPDFDIELVQFFEVIYLKFGHDFRNYSKASMKRRVSQALAQLKCDSLSTLQEKLFSDSGLFSELLSFLTIPVSEMFRDPSYFLSIREKVIPLLMTYPSLKIWIAGCSTGEEAYSFAILLKEEGLLDRTIIYATDINPISLKKAEAGIFKLSEIQKFKMNYLKAGGKADFSDYYSANVNSVIMDKSLKKVITFTDHSLSTDNVFSETHFVSCRNVLIYFEKELQERAIGLFHDSLCRKGFLGLGPKESLQFTKYAEAFDELIREDRIYQKNYHSILKQGTL
jgi:chemotaxis protein methyltransferase CheR